MSWLTANESFLIDVTAKDRIDDLRSAIDMTAATDVATVTTDRRDERSANIAARPTRSWCCARALVMPWSRAEAA